jgi:hypothetical protein
MIGGAGLIVTWLLAVHSQSKMRHVQPAPFWPLALFIGVAVFGAILWGIRIARGHKENPENITIVDVDRKIDQLIAQKAGGAPQPAGYSLTVPRGAKVSAAIGVGPLVVDMPLGGSMSLPAGTTVTPLHRVSDQARTDDSITGPSPNVPRLLGDSAATSDHVDR